MKKKIKAAILGPGNIGIDLMVKLSASPVLELALMSGIEENSRGLEMAGGEGIAVSRRGVEAFRAGDGIDIVFDATSARAHLKNAEILERLGKYVFDLTPAALGPFTIPAIATDSISTDIKNYNMVTCGGQATIPMVYAVSRAAEVEYAEIVATIASKSAGPGTRANIDEFTRTTAGAIEKLGGAGKGKAIILLNPAEPPIIMRDTILMLAEEGKDAAIIESIKDMEKTVRTYVPGYRLLSPPLIEGRKITVMLEVEGAGDYLPEYAGNLDIMTAAARRAGEILAEKLLESERQKA